MRLRLGTASNGGDSVYLLDEASGWVCLVDAAKKKKWAHDPAALTSVVAFLGLDQQGRADARALIRGVPGLKIMEERLPLQAISLRDAALYVQHMAQATKGFVGIALRCGHAVQLLLGHVLGKKLRLPRALGPCAAPAYYVGNPRTIIPSGAEARWPSYAGVLDYELEVALILGSDLEVDADDKTCAKAVQDHGGFVLINDFSARDVQADEMTSVGSSVRDWGAAVPSRHRRDSFPSDEVVGGFFFDFEVILTESRDAALDASTRRLASASSSARPFVPVWARRS